MIITELSLVEYYDTIISRAKRKNYKWIISLIGRQADAKKLYNNIEEEWASINDLTHDNVLFVFSLAPNLYNNAFFHMENEECFVGRMCPYVKTINEQGIVNKNYNFYEFADIEIAVDWKQKHSQSITEFIRKYDIREEELPLLFVWNLEKNRYSTLPLDQNINIYLYLKQIIQEETKLINQKQVLENALSEFKQKRLYLDLYESVEKRACIFPVEEKESIYLVLSGENAYLDKKNLISDKRIRNDIKRLGQWKNQFFENSTDIHEAKVNIDALLKQKEDIENRIDTIWEINGKRGRSIPAVQSIKLGDAIIVSLIQTCTMLISNEKYCGSSENERTTYLRDILTAKGYIVRDQTRHGLSPTKKDAGEIDLAILDGEKVTVLIEALNLKYLNKRYIDVHLDKIFCYDLLGNEFNIILNYVTVQDFQKFMQNYIAYIKARKWLYPLVKLDETCEEYKISYSCIRVIKSIHIRNGMYTSIYHISILID